MFDIKTTIEEVLEIESFKDKRGAKLDQDDFLAYVVLRLSRRCRPDGVVPSRLVSHSRLRTSHTQAPRAVQRSPHPLFLGQEAANQQPLIQTGGSSSVLASLRPVRLSLLLSLMHTQYIEVVSIACAREIQRCFAHREALVLFAFVSSWSEHLGGKVGVLCR